MKILFVAAEATPFVKTGGLADVVGTLPKVLRRLGADVRVVLPKYGTIADKYKENMRQRHRITVPLAWRQQYCGVEELEYDGVTYYFLDNEYYFRRNCGVYGYGDEAERYAFFSRAALEFLPYIGFKPDVIHSHDWHAGLISVFLRAFYNQNPFYDGIGTVFTIHNLAYQGTFSQEVLGDILGLGSEYFSVDGLEHYGNVSYMKGALNFSDLITTVSETYAWEIQTPYFGHGLDGLLRSRRADLFGVLNGIDYEEWDPATDPHIYSPYADSIGDKRKNKLALQHDLGLPESESVPLIGIVSRLVSQKGLDLIECVLDDIMSLDLQMVVLGTGEPRHERLFRHSAFRYANKLSANILFDNTLAHRIYAASDLYLMPSQFEPCGLSQLIALRYGSLPIVRETGGLNDTVKSYNEFTEEGNGFTFANYNAHDMLYTIRRAISFYREEEIWAGIVKNAMEADNSWDKSAAKYLKLYQLLYPKGVRYA